MPSSLKSKNSFTGSQTSWHYRTEYKVVTFLHAKTLMAEKPKKWLSQDRLGYAVVSKSYQDVAAQSNSSVFFSILLLLQVLSHPQGLGSVCHFTQGHRLMEAPGTPWKAAHHLAAEREPANCTMALKIPASKWHMSHVLASGSVS